MAEPTYRELLEDNRRLRQRVAQLEQIIRDLQARLEAAERSAKRPAAPFSEGPPTEQPQKPGRKPGKKHGRHGHRPPPPPTHIDEVLEAPLPDACPHCQGTLVETHVDQQFQTEIPRRPIVRQFNIHCGHCPKCGSAQRGRHPLQTSDATGAAASQVGPDAQAAIVYLNKHAGLSHGKIADVLDKFYGLTVSRGACAQIVRRGGQRLAPALQEIDAQLQTSEHITPDESGWRVGGRPAWIHAWVGDGGATRYAIDPRRSAEVLEELLGRDWSGRMTHDGCASYDRFQEAVHQQCVDHALRRAQALAERGGDAKYFPEQIVELFQSTLQVRDQFLRGQLDAAALEEVHADAVERLLDLTSIPRVDPANRTFAQHLYGHGEQWFMFLLDPTIPATNHRAEQALKTPIVNRKVWGGNRTEAGARAQEATSSVIQTCKKRALNAFTYLSATFRGSVASLFAAPTPVPTQR